MSEIINIPGMNNNVISILADEDAGLNSGFLYINTSTHFYVINMKDKTVYDMYSKTDTGSSGDKLSHTIIEDAEVV